MMLWSIDRLEGANIQLSSQVINNASRNSEPDNYRKPDYITKHFHGF